VPADHDREPQASGAAPLFIVLNAGSGHQDSDGTCSTIESVLGAAGRSYEIFRVETPSALADVAARAVTAARAAGGLVVAVGGDGTLNTVAQATLGSGCGFGVIPRGTFNFFGRTHGIASDTEAATRSLLAGRLRPVQVGCINDRIFLVNASLGLYPQIFEDREELKRRHGRSRLVAVWAALVTLWRGVRPLRIEIEHGDVRRRLRASTLFIGNNRLQLEQLGLPEAAALEDGMLGVVVVRALPVLALLWLMVKGALGQLREAAGIEHFALSELSVRPARGTPRRLVKVATDGEVARMRPPLRIRVAAEPLWLWHPSDAAPEQAREDAAAPSPEV
jgi:diacylglycerol kinase family enzyme